MKNIFWNHFQRNISILFKFPANQKYWLFILIVTYCLADLVILSLRPLLLSVETPPPSMLKSSQKKKSVAEYAPIWDFNIFHSGDIPASLSSTTRQTSEENQLPRLSRLPLQLNGAIVYRDPIYSIANITIKNKLVSESYQIGDKVGSLARITKIASERVYFINLNNNQEEYIEVKNMRNISFDFRKQKVKKQTDEKNNFVKQTGNSQFQVNRSDINKHLRSLPRILQDARAVPHWEKGEMIGFRLEYIKPGSVYEQLGLKKSDIIVSVAGEQPTSQIQAAELFHRLKNRSKLDIVVKRDGKDMEFSYSVNEDGVAIEEPPESRYY